MLGMSFASETSTMGPPVPQLSQPGILVVDDDPLVRNFLAQGLQMYGFEVFLAGNGEEGLDLYRREQAAIAAALLDVCMPGLDGPHLLGALRAINPTLPVCLMTGYSADYEADELLRRGVVSVFLKPFRLDEVARVLGQMVTRGKDT
jgi:DNA-binding NtrC family response regulator